MTQHEATRRIRTLRQSAALGLLLLFPAPAAYSYSVLTHEAIIDSTWDSAIKPLLLKRFPTATEDELMHAPKAALKNGALGSQDSHWVSDRTEGPCR